jgi:lipopolysaccharide/colanic/teichoic acid biosynthesis glycosyltransferase
MELAYDLWKRLFDLIFSSLVLLVVILPLMLIWVLFRVTYSGVPFFFGVPAVGLEGKKIKLWKISTMEADAHLKIEKILQDNPALRLEWERDYKLKEDPRVLPGLGSLLRKTSINEFPQFWNVLCGEMSVVGPRPISKAEEFRYIEIAGEDFLQYRHSVRPGITGLWQVSGRNNVSYEERIEFDRLYLADRSLRMDLKIFLLTPWKVIIGKGAY